MNLPAVWQLVSVGREGLDLCFCRREGELQLKGRQRQPMSMRQSVARRRFRQDHVTLFDDAHDFPRVLLFDYCGNAAPGRFESRLPFAHLMAFQTVRSGSSCAGPEILCLWIGVRAWRRFRDFRHFTRRDFCSFDEASSNDGCANLVT
jgi:hypothetical protein